MLGYHSSAGPCHEHVELTGSRLSSICCCFSGPSHVSDGSCFWLSKVISFCFPCILGNLPGRLWQYGHHQRGLQTFESNCTGFWRGFLQVSNSLQEPLLHFLTASSGDAWIGVICRYEDLLRMAQGVSQDISKTVQKKNGSSALGSRVGILYPPGVEYVVNTWAVWMMGGIAVPLSPSYSPQEISHVVLDSDASLVSSLLRWLSHSGHRSNHIHHVHIWVSRCFLQKHFALTCLGQWTGDFKE